MKRDNLKKYREDKVKENLKIVKKAIEHLKKFNLEINLSNVSKVSYDMANENKKGLSVSALCKNQIYKELINQEKACTSLPKGQQKVSYNSKTLKELSEAELIAEIYKLRATQRHKDDEIVILKDLLAEYKIDSSVNKIDRKETNEKEINLALEHILATLLEKQILYVDRESFDVKLSVYNDKILNGSLFKKIFPKESKNGTNKKWRKK